MTQATINAIRALLKSDATVTAEHAESILRICKRTNSRRHLINAREAMSILGVTRPTLRAYVKQGCLHQVNFSTRKVRFDADEIQRFANNGATAGTDGAAMNYRDASIRGIYYIPKSKTSCEV